MKVLLLASALALPFPALAGSEPVLTSLSALQAVGVTPAAKDESIGVGIARLSEAERAKISRWMHSAGKCGGYELLTERGSAAAVDALTLLSAHSKRDRSYALQTRATPRLEKNPAIVQALTELNSGNLLHTVEWLSAYPSRYNKLPDPNAHVAPFETKLRELLKNYTGKWTVEQVHHTSTRQNTLRVRLEGAKHPDEIVVLGAHLDSINQEGGSSAPGADDDASGAASIFEALRVLAAKPPAERTVELYWYAGEESGLLGSAEIARDYKNANKNVVAVLQLDMVMYPGSGQFVIGNVDDFTSPWLREYLVAMNDAYLGARLIPDHCGYGCSDHASWYRQGYPTLYPFESDTEHMNETLHTAQDVVSARTNADHALVFSKIAVVMAMDLGNSRNVQP